MVVRVVMHQNPLEAVLLPHGVDLGSTIGDDLSFVGSAISD